MANAAKEKKKEKSSRDKKDDKKDDKKRSEKKEEDRYEARNHLPVRGFYARLFPSTYGDVVGNRFSGRAATQSPQIRRPGRAASAPFLRFFFSPETIGTAHWVLTLLVPP